MSLNKSKISDYLIKSRSEVIIEEHNDKADELVAKLKTELTPINNASHWKRLVLIDCIFVGHINTDTDSVAGAIGAAEFYEGIPALASDMNDETKFCLEYFHIDYPRTIKELYEKGKKEKKEKKGKKRSYPG
jgi:hypothetical protein